MRAPKFSFHRKVLAASFLVVCTRADPPGRWLSRREFVFDTTEKNVQVEIEGDELEFGQHRDLRIVHRKDNQSGKRNNQKEVKRKRKLKNHHSHNNKEHDRQGNDHNHLRGKHGGYHHNKHQYGNEQKNTQQIDNINIDADFMGHILRRKSEPKSLDYQGGKNKKPTSKPTKKPSRQPTSVPVSDTDGRTNTNSNFPTVPATQFPVVSVADDAKEEGCSPNSFCYQEGTVCSSGQDECCGVIHASLECECADMGDGILQYMCFHLEACMSPCVEEITHEVAYFPTWAPTIGATSNSKLSNPDASSLCPTNLSQSESLLDDLSLYFEVIGDTLCMRLEYDNEGWIGLGFSTPNGRMVGSTAIIGLPDEKEAKYYALDGMAESMITPLPESEQTLQEATILQNDGFTVMTFAKSLTDDEHISMGENTFIFAAANSNQFGYHDKRGAVTLNLSS
eukprot:scaffold299_cov137-Skeletonema_dohrnii-CCMP3373.AAC.2